MPAIKRVLRVVFFGLLQTCTDQRKAVQSGAIGANYRRWVTADCGGFRDEKNTDYADHLDALPPVVAFYDGTDYWLADGFHRVAAHVLAKRETVAVDVRQGIRRDAVLFSVGANAAHGLRRTNDDKHTAVMKLLEDEEWSHKTNRWIAEKCRVSPDMVDRRRKALPVTGNAQTRATQDGREYPVDRAKPTKPTPAAQPAAPSAEPTTLPLPTPELFGDSEELPRCGTPDHEFRGGGGVGVYGAGALVCDFSSLRPRTLLLR